MPGIGIVTNPHSKLNKRNPERHNVLGYILGQRGQLAVTNSIAELESVASDFKAKDVEILAINGGDGTISRTLTAFIRCYGDRPLPKIAILGGGTINVLRTNLGIRGRPEDVLFRLVEGHSSGMNFQIKKNATLRIEDSYGFMFGDGIVANFLDLFYRHKTNALGSVLLMVRLYWAAIFNRELFLSVVSQQDYRLFPKNGRPLEGLSAAVMCSTLPRMPLGARFFTLLDKNPDKMECISFQLDESKILWQLPVMLVGTALGMNLWQQRICTRSIDIQATPGRRYTVDGELFTAEGDTIKVTMGPQLDFVTL